MLQFRWPHSPHLLPEEGTEEDLVPTVFLTSLSQLQPLRALPGGVQGQWVLLPRGSLHVPVRGDQSWGSLTQMEASGVLQELPRQGLTARSALAPRTWCSAVEGTAAWSQSDRRL